MLRDIVSCLIVGVVRLAGAVCAVFGFWVIVVFGEFAFRVGFWTTSGLPFILVCGGLAWLFACGVGVIIPVWTGFCYLDIWR